MRGTKRSDLSGPTVHSLYCDITYTLDRNSSKLNRILTPLPSNDSYANARLVKPLNWNEFNCLGVVVLLKLDTPEITYTKVLNAW